MHPSNIDIELFQDIIKDSIIHEYDTNKKDVLYQSFLLLSEKCEEVGFSDDARQMKEWAEKVQAATFFLKHQSNKANEICRNVIHTLPVNIQNMLSYDGCVNDIYKNLLEIMHFNMIKNNDEVEKIQNVLCFLDGEYEVANTIFSHDVIEAGYKIMRKMIPFLAFQHTKGCCYVSAMIK